jgi:uncharacterized membrane protein
MKLNGIKSITGSSRFITNHWILFILVLLIGTFLRFKGLTLQSFWLDEIITMNLSNPSLSLGEVLKGIRGLELHPPFHYIVIHYWSKLIAYNDFAARFLSALAGVCGVVAMYALGREIYNRRIGIGASLLTTVNYFHLYYSQEVRSYCFAFLFAVLSYYFLVKSIKDPSNRNSIFYVITTFLLIYTHYYGFVVLAAQGVTVCTLWVIEKHKNTQRLLKCFGLSCVILFLLYVHWMPTFFKIGHIKKMWIGKPNGNFFVNYFQRYFGWQKILIYLFLFIILFFFIKALNSILSSKRETKRQTDNLSLSFTVILIWIIVSYLVPYVFSKIRIPILHERYTIVTLPAILLAIAMGIELIKFNFLRNFLLVFILIISGVDLFYAKHYYKYAFKQQWREVATFVANNNPGDFPISHQKEWYYKYYFGQLNYAANFIPLTEDGLSEIKYSEPPSSFTGYGVWVLQGHNEVSMIDNDLERVLQEEFAVTKDIKCVGAWGRLYFKYRIPELDVFQFNDGDITISPDRKSVILYTNGIIESDPVFFPKGRYRLYIHCKGTEADGEFPRVRVQVGGLAIGNFTTQNFFQDIPLGFAFSNDESARIRIIFYNDSYNRETDEDRNLYIKSLMITGPH